MTTTIRSRSPRSCLRSLALVLVPFSLAGVFHNSACADEPADKGDVSPNGEASRIAIERDEDTLVTRATVSAEHGRVAWADVLRALARAKGFDDAAFGELGDGGAFDLRRPTTRIALAAINVALPEGVRFAVLPPENDRDEPQLEITLDRAAVLASRRRFHKLLASALAEKIARDVDVSQYGLQWVTTEDDQRRNEALVVIHGLHSKPEEHASLTNDLRRLQLPLGEFYYPGDQAIKDSARLLSQELKELKRGQPAWRVRLVGLSMGGLVARAAIEDPALDPGNVVQLVMVGTPNHGSALACLGFGLEIWQFVGQSHARRPLVRFYETLEDGLGDAADDLEPDSPLLKQLDARPRNPRVRYSLLLGTAGTMSEDTLHDLRQRLDELRGQSRFIQFLGPRLDRLVNDGAEMVRGRGDGLVAVERGRLQGVDDTQEFDFDHLAMGREPKTEGERELRAAIIERLKQPFP